MVMSDVIVSCTSLEKDKRVGVVVLSNVIHLCVFPHFIFHYVEYILKDLELDICDL